MRGEAVRPAGHARAGKPACASRSDAGGVLGGLECSVNHPFAVVASAPRRRAEGQLDVVGLERAAKLVLEDRDRLLGRGQIEVGGQERDPPATRPERLTLAARGSAVKDRAGRLQGIVARPEAAGAIEVIDPDKLSDDHRERPVLDRGTLSLGPGGLMKVPVRVEQRERVRDAE